MDKHRNDWLLSCLATMLAAVTVLLVGVFTSSAITPARTYSMTTAQALQTSRKAEVVQKLLRTVNGDRMLANIQEQLSLGPRFLGSPGHAALQAILVDQIDARAHKSIKQSWVYQGIDGQDYQMLNVIGRLFPQQKRRIILGTHYDSKMIADRDLVDSSQPVPGANDSASGVAVLLEVAQILRGAEIAPNVGVDIVFFDGEEGDVRIGSEYKDWQPLGSNYFVDHLDGFSPSPESGVVIDMVCDKDLHIDREYASVRNAKQQLNTFWRQAVQINSGVFSNKTGLHILDDNTPLTKAGIPSFLLIDYDYPPFHTANDTVDKCSPDSLDTVASVLIRYIYAIR